MTLFKWGSQNSQIHKDKVEWWLPEAQGDNNGELVFNKHQVSVEGRWKSSIDKCYDDCTRWM